MQGVLLHERLHGSHVSGKLVVFSSPFLYFFHSTFHFLFLVWQFVTAMNESYLSMYDIDDQARITDRQLESTLLKLKENEDVIKLIETIEIAQAKEISRLREELSNRDKQIKALVNDKANLVEEVTNFEAKA